MAQSDSSFLATYVPEEVVILLTGTKKTFQHIVTAPAEGTFCTISRLTPSTSMVNGADMSAMRVRRKNRNCTITINLLFGSETNDFFSKLLQNDEDASNNDWLFTLMIKDSSGRSLHYSKQAYIVNMPDHTFSTEGDGGVEWQIQALNVQSHVGGGGDINDATATQMKAIGYEIEDRWISNE